MTSLTVPKDVVEMKTEMFSSLKDDIDMLFKSELKTVLAEEFEDIKSELQAVRTEPANNTAAIFSDVETMKTTISHMELGLSSCSNVVTTLLTKVGKLEKEVCNLQEKSLDMEGRMRRSNIRILNVPETPGSGTPTTVFKFAKRGTENGHLDRPIPPRSTAQESRGKTRHYHGETALLSRLYGYLSPRSGVQTTPGQGHRHLHFPGLPPERRVCQIGRGETTTSGREGVKCGLLYSARLRITLNVAEKLFSE